jgi:cell division septum initiation protein DivIVA
MPCTKCEDGKYKWGKTGECEYSSKEACEKANSKYSKMKPTPLGKKTYEEYEKELKEYKTAEVKLSKAKKIELGLNQDLESEAESIYTLIREGTDSFDSANDRIREAENVLSDLDELQRDLKTYTNELSSAQDKVNALTVEAEKTANDLGIRAEDLPNYNLAEDAAKEADDIINRWDDMISDINNYI